VYCKPCLSRGVFTEVPAPRQSRGATDCEDCAESVARRRKFTVLPMHKSNYQVPANRDELIGFNNKGGLVR
jgi:hypothetical protein